MPRKKISVIEVTEALSGEEVAWAAAYLESRARPQVATDCSQSQQKNQIREILERQDKLFLKFRAALSMRQWRTKGEGRAQKHFTLEKAESGMLALLAKHEGLNETEIVRRLITEQFEKNSELHRKLDKRDSAIRKIRQSLKTEESLRSELELITKEYALLLGMIWSLVSSRDLDWENVSPAQLMGAAAYGLGFWSSEEERLGKIKKKARARVAALETLVERPKKGRM